MTLAPPHWDEEAEVVVVGYGFAGATAAMASHNAGAKVRRSVSSPRPMLAIEAGAKVDAASRLLTNEHQETTTRGLFAAGDLVRGLNQIVLAEGEAAIAATAIHNRLAKSVA